MSKPLPIKSLCRRHSDAIKVKHEASEAIAALRAGRSQTRGLDDLEQLQWAAIHREYRAWKEILDRLRAGRDTYAIAGYLGRTGARIAPNHLVEAFRAIGGRGPK